MWAHQFTDHHHYVQGVCWDPWDACSMHSPLVLPMFDWSPVISESSDRSLRVYPRRKKGKKGARAYGASIPIRSSLIPPML